MASSIQGKSPIRKDTGFSPVPLNCMHTSTCDFFRWHVVKAIPMVPNDTVSFSADTFVQGGPQPFPINGQFNYGMHAFFVPNRIVWKDWKYYYTELQQGLTMPYFTVADLWHVFHDSGSILAKSTSLYNYNSALKFISDIDSLGSILHYIIRDSLTGIPAEWQALKLDAMPLRMVQALWFDWMRDKMHISDNARSSYVYDTGGHISLQELTLLCTPKYRNYAKNMFTAAYDDPQEGASSNMLGNIPSTSENPGFGTTSNPANVLASANSTSVGKNLTNANSVIASTSVNELRKKNSEQQLKERFEVSGKTVVSRCLAMLGTSPTIEELQMAQWLGGQEYDLLPNQQLAPNSGTTGDTEFTQTAGAFGYDPRAKTIAGQKFQDLSSPQGMGLKNITYKTDETGYLIVMGCVTPSPQYYQGLPKNWTAGLDTFNSDVKDFFHSDFENQPFEPVMFYEVCTSDLISPKNIFGFQLMYSRYKQAFDSLGGQFLFPDGANLINKMHLGRDIHSLLSDLADQGLEPNEVLSPYLLRQSSAYDVSKYDDKFSITTAHQDHFNVNHKFTVNMLRPMQLFSLPSVDSELSRISQKDLIETGGFSV